MTWETFFLKYHAQNMVKELFPDPFLINQNWAYLWIISLKFTQLVFIVCQVEGHRNILKVSCSSFGFTSYKAFLESKERSGTSVAGSFFALFLNKYISLIIFYYLTKLHCLVPFTSWDIGQYMHYNYLLTRSWRHKFWS